MYKLSPILGLPILAGIFVLIVAGGLGTIFSVVGNSGTIGIGLGIVVLAPIVAAAILKRNEEG